MNHLWQPTVQAFTVTVDYDQPLEVLIPKVTRFWKDPYIDKDITSGHFPSPEQGNRALTIFVANFRTDTGKLTVNDARLDLPVHGYRPAHPIELLSLLQALGLQGRKIIAPGSSWRDPLNRQFVVAVEEYAYETEDYGSGSGRSLVMKQTDEPLSQEWHFVALRK